MPISELELAIVNVTLNARDAMPQGGLIRITGENVRLPPATSRICEGDFVALTIADTGSGIAPDILTKVFDPFFTTKQGSKGTGLGLSQVHGFAHQSGGTVAIDSKVGQGTRVVLFLPRATRAPASTTSREAEPDASRKRILLVEDNPDVATVTVGMLDELGHQSILVHNAEAALQTLERDPEFDLVFSDIVMAGMDGLQLAAELRQRFPNLPVLLTSGYTKSIEHAPLHWPLVRKPFKLAELNRALAHVTTPRADMQNDPKLVHFLEAKKNRASKNGSGC